MKIGIDARMWGRTGIGRYVKNLVIELEKIDIQNDYVIFVDKEIDKHYHPSNSKFKKWILNYSVYSFEEQINILPELYRARLDIYHVPHFNAPIFYSKPFISTIHDLTMNIKNFESTSQDKTTYTVKFYAQKFALSHAIRSSRAVIVPSNFVKSEISRKYGKNEKRIFVTYEGVDDQLTKNKVEDKGVINTKLETFRIKNDYFLYVGSTYPHKNLNNLVVSYKENLQKGLSKSQLVFAGSVDLFSQRLAGFVNGLKLTDKILFPVRYTDSGKINDEDLSFLYKGAMAYVFPSLNEGFSITPLEAQSFGIPVLLSDIPTHKEIFGDSALYFDPKSSIDISEKLLVIERDIELRKELVRKGYENIMKYSWKKMAEETLNVYNTVGSNLVH